MFDPDKSLPVDREPVPNDFVQPELDRWFLYDWWSIDLACKLITIGYPVDLERMAEEVKGWPLDCEGRDRFHAMVTVYSREHSQFIRESWQYPSTNPRELVARRKNGPRC